MQAGQEGGVGAVRAGCTGVKRRREAGKLPSKQGEGVDDAAPACANAPPPLPHPTRLSTLARPPSACRPASAPAQQDYSARRLPPATCHQLPQPCPIQDATHTHKRRTHTRASARAPPLAAAHLPGTGLTKRPSCASGSMNSVSAWYSSSHALFRYSSTLTNSGR